MKMNEKDKKQIAIIGVLILPLIFFMMNAAKSLKKKPAAAAPASDAAPAVVPAAENKPASSPAQNAVPDAVALSPRQVLAEGEIFLKLDTGAKKITLTRDPFSAAAEEVAGIRLTGILWDDKNPQAAINNMIVGVGQKVDAATVVVAITKRSVVLNDGQKNFELRLSEE